MDEKKKKKGIAKASTIFEGFARVQVEGRANVRTNKSKANDGTE